MAMENAQNRTHTEEEDRIESIKKGNEKKRKAFRTTVILVICFFMIGGAGLFLGSRYISQRLLWANEAQATDMAVLVTQKFEITDAEVAYMKSLSFNEMESDPINHRLMEAWDWGELNATISNVYVVAPLAKDEVKYYCKGEESKFFGYEDGTALDGIWLLNGRFDKNGKFEEKQRDDIYRYTSLDKEQMAGMDKRVAFGTCSSDAWGDFITGYAPLYSKEGKFVGLLGIDMSLDKYRQNVQSVVFILFLIFGITGVIIASIFTVYRLKKAKEDVLQYEKKEIGYLQLLGHLGEIDDDSLISKGRHNLTKNRVLFFYSIDTNEEQRKDIEGGPYDSALRTFSQFSVSDSKMREIEEKFQRKKLIAQYREGKTEGSFEYARYQKNGSTIWALLKYTLFEEPDSGDIMSFVYTYNMSERFLENRILARLTATEFDLLSLLDIRTHHYSIKKQSGKGKSTSIPMEGDFDEAADKWIASKVAYMEKDTVLSQLSMDTIIKELEKHETYSLSYSILEDDHALYRKRYYFTYLDETHTTILFQCSDNTEMYNKEQEQLKKTEDALLMARKANRAKTAFLSRMSHDIRTPMNTIINLTQIVEAEIDDKDKALEDLQKIDTSNQFLLSLVNDILDMTQIENQSLELHPERYSYQEFINYIRSTFEPLAKQKSIQFRIEEDEVKEDIYMDKVRFNQMCFNLLSNAMKYTQEGGNVCLKIKHEKVKCGKLPCDIYVSDNGIGMSKEFQKKMFEPFVQEERVFKTVEGTGLGLSIVKEIVNLLNGSIDVTSKVNEGTTFHIHVDMILAGEDIAHKKEASVDLGVLDGKRILLAEDHPLNQEIARRLLANVGIQVVTTENGKQAVSEFEKDPGSYDAILMDKRMPVMDGNEAAKAIRSMNFKKAKAIPIIAMTANAFAEDRMESAQAGMNEHLGKPIDPVLLYETLAKVLVD